MVGLRQHRVDRNRCDAGKDVHVDERPEAATGSWPAYRRPAWCQSRPTGTVRGLLGQPGALHAIRDARHNGCGHNSVFGRRERLLMNLEVRGVRFGQPRGPRRLTLRARDTTWPRSPLPLPPATSTPASCRESAASRDLRQPGTPWGRFRICLDAKAFSSRASRGRTQAIGSGSSGLIHPAWQAYTQGVHRSLPLMPHERVDVPLRPLLIVRAPHAS
jgi:hypothetical protein